MQIFDTRWTGCYLGPELPSELSPFPATRVPKSCKNARGTDAWVVQTRRVLPPLALPSAASPNPGHRMPGAEAYLRSRSCSEGLCMQRPDLNLGFKGSVGLVRFVAFKLRRIFRVSQMA